jgi:hypothetical protein
MNSSTIRICTISLIVILVGAGVYACVRGWRNYQTFQKTEQIVRAGLNAHLGSRKIDPIAVVVLPGASRLFGVPDNIRIEQSLFRTDEVTGRRPAGQLRGVYHRKTGQTLVDMDFVDGKRARGVSLMLDPVP